MLTAPTGAAETPLLARFSLVPARPDSTFSHVLYVPLLRCRCCVVPCWRASSTRVCARVACRYVLHRAALLCPRELYVRRATPSDRPPICAMLAGLPTQQAVMVRAGAVVQVAVVVQWVVCVCVCGGGGYELFFPAQAALSAAEVGAVEPLEDNPVCAAFVVVAAGQVGARDVAHAVRSGGSKRDDIDRLWAPLCSRALRRCRETPWIHWDAATTSTGTLRWRTTARARCACDVRAMVSAQQQRRRTNSLTRGVRACV